VSDHEVADAVDNSMFADFRSVAGPLYKFGDTRGVPDIAGQCGKESGCMRMSSTSWSGTNSLRC
jgi:hypothetical protein